MTSQPNRLPVQGKGLFAGRDIDRGRPLAFTLDKRPVHGFAGDTVLSAALASGIEIAGLHAGAPLALGVHFAPAILSSALKHDPHRVLPMARTPAMPGADYVSLGQREDLPFAARLARRLRRTLGLHGPSLGHVFDAGGTLMAPWIDFPEQTRRTLDLVVVGGGLAGMSAALAAAEAGSTVALVERRGSLGGIARLFGTTGEEEPPDDAIARLSSAIRALPNVLVLTASEALSVMGGVVRVHRVDAGSAAVTGAVTTLLAPRIVLATGSIDRLPVFAGNRRPGTVGLVEAFDLADRFGIWPGRRAVIATAGNAGYRLAMLAADAGIAIERIADPRLDPQSRFIEFSKAYGMHLARGQMPVAALPGNPGLEVRMAAVLDAPGDAIAPIVTDRLVAGGGLQPDISLYLAAGGRCRWDEAAGQLVAEGAVAGLALAGAAAGYETNQGCIASGMAAVAGLFGRAVEPFFEVRIDPIYETPDAVAPAGPASGAAPAYLAAGTSLTRRPVDEASGKPGAPWPLVSEPRALELGDIAAAVQLGAIAMADAGIVARERSIVPLDIVALGQAVPSEARPPRPPGTIPPYLAGRFGPGARVFKAEAEEKRGFEPGMLVYLNSDRAEPTAAIGVVLGPDGADALVLAAGTTGDRLVVRDGSRATAIRLVAPA